MKGTKQRQVIENSVDWGKPPRLESTLVHVVPGSSRGIQVEALWEHTHEHMNNTMNTQT